MRLNLLYATLVTILLCAASSSASPLYSVLDIGSLGGSLTNGFAINASGQITGWADISGDTAEHAFLYSNGMMTDLGTLGGTTSNGYAINDAGQITGYATGSNGTPYRFLYSDGIMTNLDPLAGATGTVGYAINASGITAGTNGNNAVIGTTDIGTLGGVTSVALGLNDAGEATGKADTAFAQHAFLYNDGIMNDLGVLGGDPNSVYGVSIGDGINASGEVTGESSNASSNIEAFLYSNGTMLDIDTANYYSSVGRAINASGEVTGSFITMSGGFPSAFIYENGTMLDLDSLIQAPGVALSEGEGINDLGQIVAVGTDNGREATFLLTPLSASTPEPSTFGMAFGAVLGGLFVMRRKLQGLR